MPAVQIAQNVAFINWTVLSGLALGSYGTVLLLRWRSTATGGYLGFTTLCALGFGILAWLSDGGLPSAIVSSPVTADPTWDGPRRAALAAFCVAVAVGLVVGRLGASPRAQRATGWLGLGLGGLALLFGALAWGGSGAGVVVLLLQFAIVAAATGGVFAAMILGHWYLVTPKLPEAPLILLARILLGVVAVQLALFIAWTVTGFGPAGAAPLSALVGPWALFIWLRLIVGLVMPLVVSWAAVQTARTRSMELATGLLYIDVGMIAAGTILAAGLYFGAGLFA